MALVTSQADIGAAKGIRFWARGSPWILFLVVPAMLLLFILFLIATVVLTLSTCLPWVPLEMLEWGKLWEHPSWYELSQRSLTIRRGTSAEDIPMDQIAEVLRKRWTAPNSRGILVRHRRGFSHQMTEVEVQPKDEVAFLVAMKILRPDMRSCPAGLTTT